MFYKGSGGLKSMFFEAISAAQKSEEKHAHCAMPRAPKKVSKRFQLSRRRQGFAPLGVITLCTAGSKKDLSGGIGT